MKEAKCVRIDSYNFGAIVEASVEKIDGSREILISTSGSSKIPELKRIYGNQNPDIPIAFTDHTLKNLAIKIKNQNNKPA